MLRTGMTVLDAAREWVTEFNAIPQSFLLKMLEVCGCDEFQEVTPPGVGDSVYIYDGEYAGCSGCVSASGCDGDQDLYEISLYSSGADDAETIVLERDAFEVEYADFFPIWGTMWTFRDSTDVWWLEENGGLQAMADCGFRIYEQEDLGYVFGIDGAGYDFYESHWVPLYRKRGLRWHDAETDMQNETGE